MFDLLDHADSINRLLARYGVKFGIYKDGIFKEQLFPFDPIPRIITPEEYEELEAGLRQRVDALNLFLGDIYGDKKILKDGIIPEDFIFSSPGYLKQCEGILPPKGIYSHISGIDLVQAKDMIALCRYLNIPSIYVAGYMSGEGASHAWVSVYDPDTERWYEIDPTNGRWVDDDYIIVSYGLDADDCIINKGIYKGVASEIQDVTVIVEEIL